MNESEKKRVAPFMRSGMTFTKLNRLDSFGDMHATDDYQNLALYSGGSSMPEHEFEHYSKFCCPCIGDISNDNLSNPQKEMLLWHWKLGIRMQHIQRLMREQTYRQPNGTNKILPPIIASKFLSMSSCTIPKCKS